jgi:hypothetical protein
MKTKLLRKLRSRGRNAISIYSVTRTNGVVTGMSIGFNDNWCSGLFSYGDTEQDVKEKAARKYIQCHIEWIRKKYYKYTRIYKILKQFK